MIISRTPLRMSFVGGGSDLASFYRKHGGAVVSTSINKYIYITVNERFDDSIRVSYSKTEEVGSVKEVEHRLVRECLNLVNIENGIEITSIADIPSKGSGLGSSSAFCVGLLNALNVYNKQYTPPDKLAQNACKIEIEICGEPIGKQDQYASAYGGLNFIEFHQDDSVSVNPIVCLKETSERLEKSCLVFYTGITRSASEFLKVQNEVVTNDVKKQAALKQMVKLAYDLRDELQRNNLDSFGQILHENWLLKKDLTAHITTTEIDHWYESARRCGAAGGKLLGAGSGGFLMFYAPSEKHAAIAKALQPLRQVQFGFEREGSKIIFLH